MYKRQPQKITISVQVHGGGSVNKGSIQVNIVDLDENPPPDPNADDRNDSFSMPAVPSKEQMTAADWSVWRPKWHNEWVWHEDPNDEEDRGYWCDHGWWEFDLDRYSAAVSYTHLDVYKRQPIKETQIVNAVDNYKLRKMSKEASAKNAVCYDPAQFAPVSYTHLDVYKRQTAQ